MSATTSVRLSVNGVDHELVVEPRLLLVHAPNASADFKRHLARVPCRWALEEAAGLA